MERRPWHISRRPTVVRCHSFAYFCIYIKLATSLEVVIPSAVSSKQSTSRSAEMTLEVLGTPEVSGGGGGAVGGPRGSFRLPRSAPDLTADQERDSPGAVSPRSRRLMTPHTSRRSPILPRYYSPHHSRSQSVRMAKRPNRLELPEFRSRVSSMPLEASRYNPRLIDDEEFYRLRSFSITAKGVVNRGDSLRSRRSRSNTSVASSTSRHSGDLREPMSLSAANSCASSHSGHDIVKYRVVILGGSEVGKTALTTQFLTSEYMNAYDSSLGKSTDISLFQDACFQNVIIWRAGWGSGGEIQRDWHRTSNRTMARFLLTEDTSKASHLTERNHQPRLIDMFV